MGCGAGNTPPNLSVGVISCSSGEGSSTIAANLAVWAARHGNGPVLLVDANVNDPTFDQSFKVELSPGLTDVLSDRFKASACVQRSPVENLSIIAAGTPNGSGLAQYKQGRVSDLLAALGQDFGLIVVDLPAATELRSDLHLTSTLDGVLLVIEAERTRIPVVQRVKKELVQANASLLGSVLNKQTSHPRRWLNRRL
jgi:capsular exopolysaccharide synthesis family protein